MRLTTDLEVLRRENRSRILGAPVDAPGELLPVRLLHGANEEVAQHEVNVVLKKDVTDLIP